MCSPPVPPSMSLIASRGGIGRLTEATPDTDIESQLLEGSIHLALPPPMNLDLKMHMHDCQPSLVF